MGLRQLLQKMRGKDEVYEQMQQQDHAATRIATKKLSHEELQLMKIHEKERQRSMRRQLDDYARKQERSMWRDNSVLNQPNMFNNQKSII